MGERLGVPPAILIIEDDVDLREALRMLLDGAGYRVHTAANGLAGLEIVRSLPRPPALILVDLIMPVMDGWQFCAEQRRIDPTTPLVIISGAWHLHSSRTRLADVTETVMVGSPGTELEFAL